MPLGQGTFGEATEARARIQLASCSSHFNLLVVHLLLGLLSLEDEGS